MISFTHILRGLAAPILLSSLLAGTAYGQSPDNLNQETVNHETLTPPLSQQTVSETEIAPIQDDTLYVGTYGAGQNSVSENLGTPQTDPNQDFCINVITGFPNDDQVARYQFFKLTDELAVDAEPDFTRALMAYEQDPLPTDIPVIDVIELIANPVVRQAAPEVVVASMNHLIDFNLRCEPYLVGQISSLTAFDASLSDSDIVIAEDALYLRQILLESLARLGASESPSHQLAVLNYSDALVRSRDEIEFKAYENDVSDVEAIFMSDLDGRLARSNDIINNEIDREILGEALYLNEDLLDDIKRQRRADGIRTLNRILNRY